MNQNSNGPNGCFPENMEMSNEYSFCSGLNYDILEA